LAEPEGRRTSSKAELRRMTEADAEAVRHIERAAFAKRWQPARAGPTERPLRTLANVLSRLRKDPGGCFAAHIDGQIVGVVFSRTWGSVGWCGSLAVHPSRQGQGIGRQLLAASLGYLQADTRRSVGLETGAGEAGNVSLYLRAGLVPCPITLHLAKDIEARKWTTSLERWSATDVQRQATWKESLREACGSVIPGLDYSKEIESAVREGIGDACLLIEAGRAVGVSVVTVESPFEGWGDDTAIVQALLIDRRFTHAARLAELLAGAEALALEAGKRRLTLVVSAGRRWATDELLALGFQVQSVGLQMIVRDAAPLTIDPDGVDCSRWAG